MKTAFTVVVVICLLLIAHSAFAGPPNDTAQILGSIFNGVSGMIDSANGGPPGPGPWGGPPPGPWGGPPGPGPWGGPPHPPHPWHPHPDPVWYTDPVYVEPQYVPPAVPSNPLPQAAQILVVNPKGNTVTLSFTVDNQTYTLAPGHARQFFQTGTIQFNRGGSYGTGRYSMTDGKYTFEMVNGRGWELYHSAN